MSRHEKISRIESLYRLVRPGTRFGRNTFAYRCVSNMSEIELDELVTRLEAEAVSHRGTAVDKDENYVPLCIDTSLPLGNQGCGGGNRVIRKQAGLT